MVADIVALSALFRADSSVLNASVSPAEGTGSTIGITEESAGASAPPPPRHPRKAPHHHHQHHHQVSHRRAHHPPIPSVSREITCSYLGVSSGSENQVHSLVIGLRVKHQWVEAGPPWVPHPPKVLSTRGTQARYKWDLNGDGGAS
ncbi:hypothetical protein Tco_1109668 [Tanacetum coccineum]